MLLKFRDDIQRSLNKNVITNRQQFVQNEDRSSSRLPVHFGVPQGSILGPTIFNIYVSELPDCIKSDSIQYADDTTVYRSCKYKNAAQSIKTLEDDVLKLQKWSSENSLIFNSTKLKSIAFSSKRNTHKHCFLLRSEGKSIHQEESVKLLGVLFDQHLTWSEQVQSISKSTYGILRTLKMFRRFTPLKVRKSLAECLVLSRLNVDHNTCKLVFQALHDEKWPSYLKTKMRSQPRILRSTNAGPKIDFGERKTWQDQATIFNELPIDVRKCDTKIVYNKEIKKFYKDKAQTRVLLL